jgi:hypothetical protein
MASSRGIAAPAVLALAALAFTAIAFKAHMASAEPPFTPQAGLLLLRNGHVLQGQVTQAGDFYVVILGPSSEIRLPAKDVEAQVATLDEAYRLKLRGMFGEGAAPHLDLADWCLRQGLHGRCSDQLTVAAKIEPENPRIAHIERRLELAITEPPPVKEKTHTSTPTATTPSSEQIEKAIRALPKHSVERFAAVVQPLLLNRCGANQCHGPNATAELHLLRPPAGQSATQRFTHRNLYSVLQQLDPADPAASPLLVEGQRRHGAALTAVFDKHTQKQLDEIKNWVLFTLAAAEPTVPATIAADGQATLSQTAQPPTASTTQPAATGNAPAATAPPPQPPVATDRFVPRDPFDPELFNRRFRGKK